MPVPKKQQKKYGMIVGANINRGKSLAEAKSIADAAIKSKKSSKKKSNKNSRSEF